MQISVKQILLGITLLFSAVQGGAQQPVGRPLSIEGTVVDGLTRKPLREVLVSIKLSAYARQQVEVRTDGQGRFLFSTVSPNRYYLFATKERYVSAKPTGHTLPWNREIVLTLSPNQSIVGLVVELFPAGILTGRIADNRGQPVVNARVSSKVPFYDTDGRRYLKSVASTRTNDLGVFRFFDLDPGEYALWVEGPADYRIPYVPVYYPGTIDPGRAAFFRVDRGVESSGGSLSLAPISGPMIQLRLTPPVPLNGGTIFVYNNGTKDQVMRRDFSGSGPFFEVGRLSPGSYDIHPSMWDFDDGGMLPVIRVDVNSSDLVLDIHPPHRVKLSGHVLVEGVRGQLTSVAGMKINWISDTSEDQHPATTKSDGSFDLGESRSASYYFSEDELPPNRCLARVTGPGDLDQRDLRDSDGMLAVEKDTEVRVVLMESIVLDGKAAASDATVVLVRDDRSEAYFDREARTDQNGSYHLSCVHPGDYHIYAWRELPGYAYRNSEFIKRYAEGGRPLKIERDTRLSEVLELLP